MRRLSSVREREVTVGITRRADARGQIAESRLDRATETSFEVSREDAAVRTSTGVSVRRDEQRRQSDVYVRSAQSDVAWWYLRKVDTLDAAGAVVAEGKWEDFGLQSSFTTPRFLGSLESDGATLEATEPVAGRSAYRVALRTIPVPGPPEVLRRTQATVIWIDASSLLWLRYQRTLTYETDGAKLTTTAEYADHGVAVLPPPEALAARSLRALSGKVNGLLGGETVSVTLFDCASGCPGRRVAGGQTDQQGRYALSAGAGTFALRFESRIPRSPMPWWYGDATEAARATRIQVAGADVQLGETSLRPSPAPSVCISAALGSMQMSMQMKDAAARGEVKSVLPAGVSSVNNVEEVVGKVTGVGFVGYKAVHDGDVVFRAPASGRVTTSIQPDYKGIDLWYTDTYKIALTFVRGGEFIAANQSQVRAGDPLFRISRAAATREDDLGAFRKWTTGESYVNLGVLFLTGANSIATPSFRLGNVATDENGRWTAAC